MAIAQSAAKLVRNLRAATEVSPRLREEWLSWIDEQRCHIWPDLGREAKPVLDRRVKATNGGIMVRGRIEDENSAYDFWIKWCPDAALAALDQTASRMSWWQEHHPEQAYAVAKVLAYWPEQKTLLLEHRSGRPLGQMIEAGSPDVGESIISLARWLREFAQGRQRYDTSIESLLGSQVRHTDDGRLFVDARTLLTSRITYANQAANRLVAAGLTSARLWTERFDINRILSVFRTMQPAGFIHGDLNPDNILANGPSFSVIDWWTAPRVSWPLQDVATFAANLWLYDDRESAERAWLAFAGSFFLEDPEESIAQAIDLLGTMMCLGLLARKLDSGIDRIVSRKWCKKTLERLVDPESEIGQYDRRSIDGMVRSCEV